MTICALDGCDRPVSGRGLCKRHYNAAWKKGDLPQAWTRRYSTPPKSHDQRLREKFVVAPSGCWEWTASTNRLGYGTVGWWRDGKHHSNRAHRLAYETWVGPITDGLHVLHKCDNRKCVNPDHLYLGTHRRNMRDLRERGGRKGIGSGVDNGRAKLTMDQVREIRSRYSAGGISQQALGDEYGVSQFAVSAIVRGKRYAE